MIHPRNRVRSLPYSQLRQARCITQDANKWNYTLTQMSNKCSERGLTPPLNYKTHGENEYYYPGRGCTAQNYDLQTEKIIFSFYFFRLKLQNWLFCEETVMSLRIVTNRSQNSNIPQWCCTDIVHHCGTELWSWMWDLYIDRSKQLFLGRPRLGSFPCPNGLNCKLISKRWGVGPSKWTSQG